MGGATFKPEPGVVTVYAAADLQTARPGGKGLCGSLFIARPKHDNMAAGETILPIHSAVVGRRQVGGKIGERCDGTTGTQS